MQHTKTIGGPVTHIVGPQVGVPLQPSTLLLQPAGAAAACLILVPDMACVACSSCGGAGLRECAAVLPEQLRGVGHLREHAVLSHTGGKPSLNWAAASLPRRAQLLFTHRACGVHELSLSLVNLRLSDFFLSLSRAIEPHLDANLLLTTPDSRHTRHADSPRIPSIWGDGALLSGFTLKKTLKNPQPKTAPK